MVRKIDKALLFILIATCLLILMPFVARQYVEQFGNKDVQRIVIRVWEEAHNR